jgi:hypothetical protein
MRTLAGIAGQFGMFPGFLDAAAPPESGSTPTLPFTNPSVGRRSRFPIRRQAESAPGQIAGLDFDSAPIRVTSRRNAPRHHDRLLRPPLTAQAGTPSRPPGPRPRDRRRSPPLPVRQGGSRRRRLPARFQAQLVIAQLACARGDASSAAASPPLGRTRRPAAPWRVPGVSYFSSSGSFGSSSNIGLAAENAPGA